MTVTLMSKTKNNDPLHFIETDTIHPKYTSLRFNENLTRDHCYGANQRHHLYLVYRVVQGLRHLLWVLQDQKMTRGDYWGVSQVVTLCNRKLYILHQCPSACLTKFQSITFLPTTSCISRLRSRGKYFAFQTIHKAWVRFNGEYMR